jgi:predicted metal-dependent peptidase
MNTFEGRMINQVMRWKEGRMKRLAMAWKIVEKPDVGTAATNGPVLYYNPEFVNKLSAQDLYFLLIHEVGHVMLRHSERLRDMTRGQPYDKRAANVAADIADNVFSFSAIATDINTITIGGIHLQTENKNESGLVFRNCESMESIYAKIAKKPEGQQPDDPQGDGETSEGEAGEQAGEVSGEPGDGESSGNSTGGVMPAPDGWSAPEFTQADIDELGKEQAEILTNEGLIKDRSIRWIKAISTWMTETVGQKHEHFNRPSRRQMRGGCACPTMSGGSPRRICVMIDVSGSMDATVKDILKVLKQLKATVNCYMDIYQVDHGVREKFTLRLGQGQRIPENYEVYGYGGTHFTGFFEMLQDQKRHGLYDVFIGYTDGCVSESEKWMAPCAKDKCAWVIWGYGKEEGLKTATDRAFKPTFGKKFYAAKDQII